MKSSTEIPNLRILLAEDNDANRMVASALLEQTGHRVCVANNGADALSCLHSELFDLVLLDVMMPVLDGLRTLRRIKRSFPSRVMMPIFALTAHTDVRDRQRYRLAGFDAIVSKPLMQGDVETAWRLHHSSAPMAEEVISQPSNDVSPPLLDLEVIRQLKCATTTERCADILASFWGSTETLCKDLKKTLPCAMQGEVEALTLFRHTVHTLKGASLSVGAYRVAECARILRNAPPAEIPHKLNDLIRALLESRAELSLAYSDSGSAIRTG